MTANKCSVHGFTHVSLGYPDILSIHQNYDNILMKFIINGVASCGRLMSTVMVKNIYYSAIEMSTACPGAYSKTLNSTFTCLDRRGVLVPEKIIECCQITSKHEALQRFTDKMVNEDSVCCVFLLAKLSQWPSLCLGDKCRLSNIYFKSYVGVCQWMGRINGIECIGVEMTEWISNECRGYCLGRKVFDCRHGHGMLLQASDIIPVNPGDIVLDQCGFVDLKCVYYAKKSVIKTKDVLQIGGRAKLIFQENDSLSGWCYKNIFGVVKWMGKINKVQCLGIELDHLCKGGMNGVINSVESFICESGCGVVCPVSRVALDQYSYSLPFTVEETLNVDQNFSYKEDWDQSIVEERNLKLNTNIFVYIEKNDRILSVKGTIRWCGYVKNVSVAILEMEDPHPLTPQERITEILKIETLTSYIIVHTQFLFHYRTLKSYEIVKDIIPNLDLENDSDFGRLKWRGLDSDGRVYYGFELESPSKYGTGGIFYGQKLFECRSGCGALLSLQKIRESVKSRQCDPRFSLSDESDDEADFKGNESRLISLYSSIINKNKIPIAEVITSAMAVEDPRILRIIIDNLEPSFDIGKHQELLSQLVTLGSFKNLSLLVDKCASDDTNNKVFLRVASEFLRNKKYKYFERCMDKCTDKNMEMDNGETFVTYIIKEKVDQRLILAAIKDYEFDSTKPNTAGEEPLTLACGNMMMEVMGGIMKYIKEQEARKKACVICMDREIDTVFNCGHNSCKQCSDNIDCCPICKVEIESRGKLYFS